MSKTVKIILGTIIAIIVCGTSTFAGLCFVTNKATGQALIQLGNLEAATAFGIAFFVGMAMGFFLFLWYPIVKIMNWLKTRKLKNANLELDLKIKQKQLEQMENPSTSQSNNSTTQI